MRVLAYALTCVLAVTVLQAQPKPQPPTQTQARQQNLDQARQQHEDPRGRAPVPLGTLVPPVTASQVVVQPAPRAVDPCAGRNDGACAFPMWDGSITRLGTFTMPDWDVTGKSGAIDYGGRTGAFGVSQDGKRILWSCSQKPGGPFNTNVEGFTKFDIPALGTKGKGYEPCAGPGRAEVALVHPDPSAWRPQFGGVVEQNGRIAVIGYIEYDASGSTTSSHWSGKTFTTMAGPFRLVDPNPALSAGLKTGYVKQYNGRVPTHLQALLGGDTFATAGYSSIISRSSFGPNLVVYNIADVTKPNVPAKMWLGCPNEVASCVRWLTPSDPGRYDAAEQSGGSFFVPGTRTFVAIERESDGPSCYGYATRNQAEHGRPYLDAVYCYSLSDPLSSKGPKGYPYRLVAKAYDLARIIAQKNPWDAIYPDLIVTLPDSTPGTDIYGGGGAFNDVTGEYYKNPGHYGDGTQITVYKFGAGQPPPPPPPPIDCVGTWGAWTRVKGSETACVNSSRTFREERVFTVTTPASGTGKACPPSPESRTQTESCTPPPPPPPTATTVTMQSGSVTTTCTLTVTGGTSSWVCKP